MTIRIMGVAFAGLLLCGCSAWDNTMIFVGLELPDQAAHPAASPAAHPVTSQTQASKPDDWCRQIAKATGEEAAGEGFDAATQRHRAEATYQQCVTPAGAAPHSAPPTQTP